MSIESNISKLDSDGKPVRGPNFFPPEPKIRELLSQLIEEKQ